MTSQSQRLVMTGIPGTLAIWPRGQARSEALIEIRCSEIDGSPSQGATAQVGATQGLLTRHGDDAWASKASAITDNEGAALFDYTAHWTSGTAPGTSEIEAIVHYQDRGSPCCGTESRWDRPLKRRTRKSDHQEDDDQHAEQEEEKLTQSDLADPRLLKFLEKCESTELHRPQAPERQQMEHQRNGRREKAKKEKGLEKHHEG